jgi:hypothetical protein
MDVLPFNLWDPHVHFPLFLPSDIRRICEVFEHAFADIPIRRVQQYLYCIWTDRNRENAHHDGGRWFTKFFIQILSKLLSQGGKEMVTTRGMSSGDDNDVDDEEAELDPEKKKNKKNMLVVQGRRRFIFFVIRCTVRY